MRIRLCSRYDPVTRQTRVCRCASALTLVTVHRSSPLRFCISLLLAAFRPPSSYRPIVNGCLRAQEVIVMSCLWESVAPSRRRLVVNGYLGPLSAQFFIKKSFNHLVLLRYSILYLVVLCRRISVLITSSGHIWAWNQSRNCHCHAFLFGLSITIYLCHSITSRLWVSAVLSRYLSYIRLSRFSYRVQNSVSDWQSRSRLVFIFLSPVLPPSGSPVPLFSPRHR